MQYRRRLFLKESKSGNDEENEQLTSFTFDDMKVTEEIKCDCEDMRQFINTEYSG